MMEQDTISEINVAVQKWAEIQTGQLAILTEPPLNYL